MKHSRNLQGELEEPRQCLEAKLRNNKNLSKDKHMRKHIKANIVTILYNSTFIFKMI